MTQETIDISGLDKGAVLAALYNASKPLGMGFLQYDPEPMTVEQGNEILSQTTDFDYLKGRVMKLSLNSDELDPWGYDRDNGAGEAKAVIDELRRNGLDSSLIAKKHLVGVAQSAEDTAEMMATPTTVSGSVVNLGLDDVADILRPYVEPYRS